MVQPSTKLTVIAVLLCSAAPLTVQAQTASSGADAATPATSEEDAPSTFRPRKQRGDRQSAPKLVRITPYIDVSQVMLAELSPSGDVLTYTQAGIGVDAALTGRNTEASVSLRYERRIGYGGRIEDANVFSGLARGQTTIAEGVKFEAGALATRTQVQGNGSAVSNAIVTQNSQSNVFSVFAGPSLETRAGDVALSASYRIGYTKIDTSDDLVTAGGVTNGDVFDSSVVHQAGLRAAIAPGDVLPVGIAASASAMREDISNLDQRVKDLNARLDLTYPVSQSVALVGGIGYEDVEVSSRDALRDALGNPITGADGRFVTDKSQPRQLAYDSSGLIWDAGVQWRPGPRTALEARVGRRYGGMTYIGSFSWQPGSRSAVNVALYDSISGFGGKLNGALALLPSSFQTNRNPLSGNISGCVSSADGGSCLSSSLGSVRSATFRSRGIAASYGYKFGRYAIDLGGGYDRRRLIAAPGSILATSNGLIENNYWANAQFNAQLDQNSSVTTNLYGNWFQSGSVLGGDVTSFGATAGYNRQLTQRLSGKLAAGIDNVSRDGVADDITTVSALVGLRYNF